MKSSTNRRKWYLRPNYVGFSIGCAIAWAVIWSLVAVLASTRTVHTLGYVFLGWVIGWTTATLARVVYPAPKITLFAREPDGRRR
jgi:hypothetical protein